MDVTKSQAEAGEAEGAAWRKRGRFTLGKKKKRSTVKLEGYATTWA